MAETYKTLNLDEALTEEEIEHDFSEYKETDEQITIYLFRGKGCAYCRAFLTFLNSIVDDYGKYFKVVSYEVWNDTTNNNLLSEVSTFLNEPADGVPYIIIGDKVFGGYSEAYDEDIKKAIVDLYNSSDRYDVFAEMEKTTSSNPVSTTAVVVWNLLFVITSTTIIIITNHYNNKKIMLRLDALENNLKKGRVSK